MDWFLYDKGLRHEKVKNPAKHLRWILLLILNKHSPLCSYQQTEFSMG